MYKIKYFLYPKNIYIKYQFTGITINKKTKHKPDKESNI